MRSAELSRAFSTPSREFSCFSAVAWALSRVIDWFSLITLTLKNTIPTSSTPTSTTQMRPRMRRTSARRTCARPGAAPAPSAAAAPACAPAPPRAERSGQPLWRRAASAVRLQLARHAELARRRTRIRRDLSLGGRDRAPGQQLGLGSTPADAHGELGRAHAASRAIRQEALDAPVLQRVEGDS